MSALTRYLNEYAWQRVLADLARVGVYAADLFIEDHFLDLESEPYVTARFPITDQRWLAILNTFCEEAFQGRWPGQSDTATMTLDERAPIWRRYLQSAISVRWKLHRTRAELHLLNAVRVYDKQTAKHQANVQATRKRLDKLRSKRGMK